MIATEHKKKAWWIDYSSSVWNRWSMHISIGVISRWFSWESIRFLTEMLFQVMLDCVKLLCWLSIVVKHCLQPKMNPSNTTLICHFHMHLWRLLSILMEQHIDLWKLATWYLRSTYQNAGMLTNQVAGYIIHKVKAVWVMTTILILMKLEQSLVQISTMSLCYLLLRNQSIHRDIHYTGIRLV